MLTFGPIAIPSLESAWCFQHGMALPNLKAISGFKKFHNTQPEHETKSACITSFPLPLAGRCPLSLMPLLQNFFFFQACLLPIISLAVTRITVVLGCMTISF